MASIDPQVTLINEYYDTRYTNVGPYGSFTYSVKGIPIKGVENNPQAQALGLPVRGALMPGVDGAIAWAVGVTTVTNSLMGFEACFVRVDFKPINWNISRYLGGRTFKGDGLPYSIPVIYNVYRGLVSGVALWVQEPKPFIRSTSYRVETHASSGSLDPFQNFRDENLGKLYVFGGINYVLDNVVAKRDRGNNVVVDTYFYTTAGIVEYPADAWNGGNSLPIPKLLNLEEYDIISDPATGAYSSIRKKTAPQLYAPGIAPIPWF